MSNRYPEPEPEVNEDYEVRLNMAHPLNMELALLNGRVTNAGFNGVDHFIAFSYLFCVCSDDLSDKEIKDWKVFIRRACKTMHGKKVSFSYIEKVTQRVDEAGEHGAFSGGLN